MSNGMYCSASQWMDSASSAAVMTGRLIFLTMTALPESDAATSLVVKVFCPNNRLIASATATPSTIAPSTMLSGGIGSVAKAVTLNVLPTAFNSTALTALEPMSSPTTALFFARPNTGTSSTFCSSRDGTRNPRQLHADVGKAITELRLELRIGARSRRRPFRKGSATRCREISSDFECRDANSAITSVNRPRTGLTDPSRDYRNGSRCAGTRAAGFHVCGRRAAGGWSGDRG